MPILKTKYEEIEVQLDDELKLVIPSEHSRPCIFKVNRFGSYPVGFWDLEKDKYRTLTFRTLAEAEKHRDSVTWTREQVMKTVLVSDVLEKPYFFQKYHRLCPQKIDYEEQDVPLDPKFIGIWLGDGASYCCKITTADKEILEYITEVADSYGMKVIQEKYAIDYRISSGNHGLVGGTLAIDKAIILEALKQCDAGRKTADVAKDLGIGYGCLRKYIRIHKNGGIDEYYESRKPNPISTALKAMGVWGNKHIPKCYLENTREIRLQVLAGIIDTDGYLQSESGYDMCFSSKRLLDDIITLARSLGFSARDAVSVTKMCTNAAGGPKACQAYRSYISGGNDLRDIPVLLDRKRIKKDKVQRYDQAHFEIIPDRVVIT
jgi:replicative DNA helicase